jgi:glycosyltransferase involved in cell wall biosynthesis
MRLIIHDYSGHPFQVQLSRELARRGYTVLHQHFAGFQTPKGALLRQPGDPATFSAEGLELDEPFAKQNLAVRVRQEWRYGRVALAAARAFEPDVFIASNMPLDPLGLLQRELAADGCRFVLWWQDIYSIAMAKILPRKLPLAGRLVAERYRRLERRIARDADAIVCITDDFRDVLAEWGIAGDKATTIENWAPLDEIRPLATPTAWARQHGLHDRPILLYAGTLGLKHNPALLWEAAVALRDAPDLAGARVVVVSEGIGADWLAERHAEAPDVPLTLLPFQPYDRFSEVLATASVVTAILEPDAGVFSVPSKVLSYLAAARPVLLAAPAENLASRTVVREGAGEVARPDDPAGFAARAVAALRAPTRCRAMGARGRTYAERAFDVSRIADRFETLWTTPADIRRSAA